MTIAARSPVREDVAACTSRNSYYPTKGSAVRAIESVLNGYGYSMDHADYSGDEGSVNVGLWLGFNALGDYDGYVHLSWYRMGSGSYEFTVYIT